jgi:hypothetical protein
MSSSPERNYRIFFRFNFFYSSLCRISEIQYVFKNSKIKPVKYFLRGFFFIYTHMITKTNFQ